MGLQRTLQDPRLNEVAAVLRVACQTGLVQATAGLPGEEGWGPHHGAREAGREGGKMDGWSRTNRLKDGETCT